MARYLLFLRIICGAALLSITSGCDIINLNDRLLNSSDKRITDYRIIPASMAWASVPGQRIVMQRSIGNEVEQVLFLPNDTTVPGDNQMILRASRKGNERAGRLRIEALRYRIGGFPVPFANLENSDMVTAEDDLGAYTYATKVYGDITCALALRKVDGTDRPIPLRRNAMDAVMRNCVTGPVDEALKPIAAENFGYSGFTGTATTAGTRLISPLSAPLPN